jgi:signal transduction histidine kinase
MLAQSQWVRSERTDMNLCALSSGQSAVHTNIDDAWLRRAASNEGHLEAMRTLDFCSMLTVPLRYENRLLGALTLFYADSKRQYSPEDVKLAEEIARRAAAALENARLFKEAQDAVALRDEFLSVAGHELRTPLTALQLHLGTLQRRLQALPAPPELVERTEKASRNLLRFNSLVNELLDISRISSGRLTLEKTDFDLAECVRDVVGHFQEELSRSSCAVHVRADSEVVGRWDRLRMEQIVSNLVSNAIKYGLGKPIEVTVERTASAARVRVKDHGIGISEPDQQRVFQRFERAVSSRHFGGFGLGLWIVRQLVEAHQGAIRVESVLGEGASFDVQLPLS